MNNIFETYKRIIEETPISHLYDLKMKQELSEHLAEVIKFYDLLDSKGFDYSKPIEHTPEIIAHLWFLENYCTLLVMMTSKINLNDLFEGLRYKSLQIKGMPSRNIAEIYSVSHTYVCDKVKETELVIDCFAQWFQMIKDYSLPQNKWKRPKSSKESESVSVTAKDY